MDDQRQNIISPMQANEALQDRPSLEDILQQDYYPGGIFELNDDKILELVGTYQKDQLYQEIINEIKRRADQLGGEEKWYIQNREENYDPIYLVKARNVYEYWLKIERCYDTRPKDWLSSPLILKNISRGQEGELSIFEIIRRKKVNQLLHDAKQLYPELRDRDVEFCFLPNANWIVQRLFELSRLPGSAVRDFSVIDPSVVRVIE